MIAAAKPILANGFGQFCRFWLEFSWFLMFLLVLVGFPSALNGFTFFGRAGAKATPSINGIRDPASQGTLGNWLLLLATATSYYH